MNRVISKKFFFLIIVLVIPLGIIIKLSNNGRIYTFEPRKIEKHYNHHETKQENNINWLGYNKNWDGEILIINNPKQKAINFTDEYRWKMISKGLHPLNIEHERLHDRHDRIEKYCSTFKSQSNGLYRFNGYYSMLFNDRFQLLQCVIQKVSSSTWVSIFLELGGFDSQYLPESHPIWQKISLVNNLTDSRLLAQRFQTYTKFLLTRHPFERLLSAYKDKFILHSYGDQFAYDIIVKNYLSNVEEDVIRQMREKLKRGENDLNINLSNSTIKQIARLNSGAREFNITFLEFLNYIIAFVKVNEIHRLDYHWAPITIVCDPCEVRYDIIGKFETLSEDSEAILDYVQPNNTQNRVTFPKRDPKVTNNLCNEAFMKIPLNVKRSLYEIYKEDFILFDYEYREEDGESNTGSP
ncbi:Carbohydrate sulfotransferase 10-like [Oopsacas minuta]|uniref:Carbohydrate sulfotransferase n=1 Tax=Oopsacas minuta TaxID=111878 RepID=A0AAV7JYK2_9METZ|nr:Carbohydrate sulfotransferase 10-like [Oopsacas minuta]